MLGLKQSLLPPASYSLAYWGWVDHRAYCRTFLGCFISHLLWPCGFRRLKLLKRRSRNPRPLQKGQTFFSICFQGPVVPYTRLQRWPNNFPMSYNRLGLYRAESVARAKLVVPLDGVGWLARQWPYTLIPYIEKQEGPCQKLSPNYSFHMGKIKSLFTILNSRADSDLAR